MLLIGELIKKCLYINRKYNKTLENKKPDMYTISNICESGCRRG